jgi:hypothetical protein
MHQVGCFIRNPLLLSDVNQTWIFFSTVFFKNPKYRTSWKFVQWEPSCSMRTDGRTDGQTEMMQPIAAFRNFANAPKNNYKIILPSVLYLPSCILSTSFRPKPCMCLTLPVHDYLNSAVFTSLKTAVFWAVTSCNSVEMYSHSVSFCKRFSFSLPFYFDLSRLCYVGRQYRSFVSFWPVKFSNARLEASHLHSYSVIGLAEEATRIPFPWHLTYRVGPSVSSPGFSAGQKLTYGLWDLSILIGICIGMIRKYWQGGRLNGLASRSVLFLDIIQEHFRLIVT